MFMHETPVCDHLNGNYWAVFYAVLFTVLHKVVFF